MKAAIRILSNTALLLIFLTSVVSFSVAKYSTSTTSSQEKVRVAKYDVIVTKKDIWSNAANNTDSVVYVGTKTYSFAVKNNGETATRVRVVTESGTVSASPSGWFNVNKDDTVTATVSVDAPDTAEETNTAKFHFEYEQVN